MIKQILNSGIIFALVLLTVSSSNVASALSPVAINAGDLIKASGDTVYYYAEDGGRYTFPTESTYKTWYNDFSSVIAISDDQLGGIDLKGNVLVRPGTKLVKITTVPKVFAVEPKGVLRHLKDEMAAVRLYSENWSDRVIDIPDGFWENYDVSDNPLDGSEYPSGTLVKFESSPNVFHVGTEAFGAEPCLQTNSDWRMLTNDDAMSENNFDANNIVVAPDDMVYVEGFPLLGFDFSLFRVSQQDTLTSCDPAPTN